MRSRLEESQTTETQVESQTTAVTDDNLNDDTTPPSQLPVDSGMGQESQALTVVADDEVRIFLYSRNFKLQFCINIADRMATITSTFTRDDYERR